MTINRHTITVPPMPHDRATVYRHHDKTGAASLALLDWIIDHKLRKHCDKALRELVDFRRAER